MQDTETIRKARSNCEDICLIAKFLDGSKSAFEELFHKHQRKLFSVCRHFLGSSVEAEDATQDTFLSIYRGLKYFKGESSFRTWAYQITARTCMTRMHRIKRHNELSAELIEHPSARGNQSIDHIVVQDAISKLPDHYRAVLILRYYEQLSTEETAEALGCSIGQIKMRLHRSRNALKDILSQTTGGEIS